MKNLLILTFFFISGCSVTPFVGPIVTGVVMWSNGEARKYYNEDAKTIYKATKMSLKELDYQVLKDDSTKDGGYYIVTSGKDNFKIYIRRVKPHITEVRIRVNIMGDKPYAELIYNQIDSNSSSIEFDTHGKPTKNKSRRHVDQ